MGFLAGKTAIITGAGYAKLSNGRCGSIGYGIATAYAKEGANLVITGRNVKKLTDAKEELERLYGVKVLCVQADVNDSADNEAVVNNVVKQAIDTFGRIDVLINNAQASASGVPLADHTTEQFNLALYSGLYATFYYMNNPEKPPGGRFLQHVAQMCCKSSALSQNHAIQTFRILCSFQYRNMPFLADPA